MGSTTVVGQLNIKVGYTGGYTSADEVNDIFRRFNDERPFLEEQLNELHILSGLELGLRYRISSSALEISWANMSAESEALGTDPQGSTFRERAETGIRSYSVGIDNFIGDFGFGGSFGTRRLKMKTDISGFDKKREVFKSTGYFSRFHIFYQVTSNRVSLTFKPYIEVPWGKLNVAGLEKEYFPDSTTPVDQFDSNYTLFGISLLFYNGRQN